MASRYKLGTTYATMQTLDALGLPDPYPATFVHATEQYEDGAGRPQADGFATAVWRFDILTMAQWGTLTGVFSGQSRQVSICTRIDIAPSSTYESQFKSYDGYMVRPDSENYDIEMGYYYRNVEINFVALAEHVV